MSTDLLDGGRPRRLILRKGRWYLEVARLVSTGDGVFRPHSQRIEGRAAILETLRHGKTSASLADSAAKLVDNGVGGDATFHAVEGKWVPSGLAPSSVKQLGRSDIRTPAEAALVAELTLLRASHEGLLARVARLERMVFGEAQGSPQPFVGKLPRRNDVPFAATLREGLPPADSASPHESETPEGGARAVMSFTPADTVAARLSEICGQEVPLKEETTPVAEWIVSPPRFQVAFLLDDSGGTPGAMLLDVALVARVGGALLGLPPAEIDEQAASGAASPDATAAASEICGYLTNSLNEIPGNPHVRAKALAPLAEPMPDWLADPTVLLVCTHAAGGTLAFVAQSAG